MQFENLDVWQRSADLACEVYLHFKLSKEFGLKDQITRSALSISSNIAGTFEQTYLTTQQRIKDLFVTSIVQP
jgi:four helix bundle protein